MLEESFIILPGISKRTEQRLWSQGINNWQQFLEKEVIPGISRQRKGYYDRLLREAQKSPLNYFVRKLPSAEQYRLFTVSRNCLYLDIETSNKRGDVTIVGLSNGEHTRTLIKGKNCDQHLIREVFAESEIIITFNGKSFDLPLLEKTFGALPERPHIDLRTVCSRLGYNGGLKAIEKEMGIQRREPINSLKGGDTQLLWKRFHATGDSDYLEWLLEYNAADVENLIILAKKLIKELWKKEKITSFC